MTNGGALDADGQMLAPEVTAIEFLYFDGSQWAETWDTTEKGGPPVAVEVAISVRSTAPSSIIARAWSAVSGNADEPEETVYRQVVYLPSAEPTSSSDSTGDSTDASMDGSSSAGGSQ
jgi:hypothetical protein